MAGHNDNVSKQRGRTFRNRLQILNRAGSAILRLSLSKTYRTFLITVTTISLFHSNMVIRIYWPAAKRALIFGSLPRKCNTYFLLHFMFHPSVIAFLQNIFHRRRQNKNRREKSNHSFGGQKDCSSDCAELHSSESTKLQRIVLHVV